MSPKSNEPPITEASPLFSQPPTTREKSPEVLWKKVYEEFSEQTKTAFPTLQSMLLTKIP
eukprot:scaffold9153_cov121-Cylindrotheca_fusiformis.AAC.4